MKVHEQMSTHDISLQSETDSQTYAHPRRNETLIITYILFGFLALEVQGLSSGFNFGNLIIISFIPLVLFMTSVKGGLPFKLNIRLKTHDYLFGLYILYLVVTASWSVSPNETLIAAVPVTAVFLISIFLGYVRIHKLIKLTIFSAFCAAILSIALIFIDANIAYQPKSSTGVDELRGVFKHQLRLGAFMCVAAGLIAISVLNNNIQHVLSGKLIFSLFVVIAILIALYLSRTRLYTLAAVVSLALTIGISRNGAIRWVTFAFLGCGAIAIIRTYENILLYLESIGFDTSLTARTLIWTRTRSAINEDVYWFGYGYDSFVNPYFDYIFSQNYRPAHAHNSFIQSHFETGMIGMILLMIIILFQFRAILKIKRDNNIRYSYALFLFLFCFFGSLFGLNYGGALSVVFCIFLLFLSIETRLNTRASAAIAHP